jgi:two-component system CheB/CheR fusion protein
MPGKKKPSDSKGSASPPMRKEKQKSPPKAHPSEKQQPQISQRNNKMGGFPIVGMGASAGGLEAFERFFKNLPQDSGMAFGVVSHLDPSHASIMPELLQKHTRLKVVQVKDGMKVEKGHVYVIPPDKDMGMVDGTLFLASTKTKSSPRAPVNFFLRSLAQDQGEKAIGVILSGMGTDGTEGVKAIKAELGMVMAQEPKSCKYDSMPRNAIATGLVDYVLAPEEMPERLKSYVAHAVLKPVSTAPAREDIPSDAVNKIHMLLRSVTGHDFSAYKESTIIRRIQRRMDVHQIEAISNYLSYASENAEEVKSLFKELLIGVTGFFRDADAFDTLKKKALSPLLDSKPYSYTLRAWVPGCATGEEAYSLAIAIQECMEVLKKELSVQIFATDIDEGAIERARAGVFPGDIAGDVGPERLEKFFHSTDDSYRVNRKIREMIVFASQSLIKDPPFTRLDIICCRNLLIYLRGELQKKLLPLFHYSLRPGGMLFLGPSESVGEFADLFSVLDNKWKIYQYQEAAVAAPPPAVGLDFGHEATREPLPDTGKRPAHQLSQMVQSHLMEHYTPASVVIDGNGDVAYIHGRTGKYLEPAAGVTRANNIIEMAREGLRTRLPTMIRTAASEKKAVRNRLRVGQNGEFILVDVTVKPLAGPEHEDLYIVVFEEVSLEERNEKEKKPRQTVKGGDGKIQQLEEELRYTKENLQTTIEELETSNEELRSMNEEYQSANEELQSANEELNSSKEELQSLNEELETVNAELQGKNYELTRVNDDMKNLMDSIEVPTVFLDNQLHISRFTSGIDKIFNLRGSDVGRPLSDLASKLGYRQLTADAKEVLVSLVPKQFEAQTEADRWYAVRIRPYRSADNVIDGLVMTFVDIQPQKMAAQRAEEIIDAVREPLVVLDEDLRVERANNAFYRKFRVKSKDTVGRRIYDLGKKQWDIPKLRELLEKIIPENTFFEDFEVEHEFPKIGRKKFLLNALKVRRGDETPESILLSLEDVTNQ